MLPLGGLLSTSLNCSSIHPSASEVSAGVFLYQSVMHDNCSQGIRARLTGAVSINLTPDFCLFLAGLPEYNSTVLQKGELCFPESGCSSEHSEDPRSSTSVRSF